MSTKLTCLRVMNFRSLADIAIQIRDLNVLFGPNGAGKTTLLDTIYFVRDCAMRGVEWASTERSHGIGARWDGAKEGANIEIELETDSARYRVSFAYASGRIEPYVGESFYSKNREIVLIDRKAGSNSASFYHCRMQQSLPVELREPEKLALSRYIDLEEDTPQEAEEMHRLLSYINFYHAREADIYRLKKLGSESSHHQWLSNRCQNLWSVLRNLHDRRSIDERYDTIIDFMRRAFPIFEDLVLEQTGPTTVYGNFLEKGRRQPIMASGVSDGHLQMLIHLTALFSEGPERHSLIMFDEPETSLHPYALSVLAEAVNRAVTECNKQVFIATHSPVLLGQFQPDHILAMELGELGQTVVSRVSEKSNVQDLLEDYSVGSLYMAELLAPQSSLRLEGAANG